MSYFNYPKEVDGSAKGTAVTLIGTNFRGYLIWRKKGQHISRVFILAIWVQNYFLRELIFAKMKKKTDFENFIITLLIAENRQLITKPN